jgi:hypothetical protein
MGRVRVTIPPVTLEAMISSGAIPSSTHCSSAVSGSHVLGRRWLRRTPDIGQQEESDKFLRFVCMTSHDGIRPEFCCNRWCPPGLAVVGEAMPDDHLAATFLKAVKSGPPRGG